MMATEGPIPPTGDPNSALINQSIERILTPSRNPPKYDFTFNDFLRREHRVGLGPDIPICEADRQGHCPLGNNCPKKHDNKSSFNRLICKHWMRGLCKKGATCDFKHEYNLRGERECPEFARWGYCSAGEDCLYAHIDPLYKRPSCPWYDRGFCPLGPQCANRHVKKEKLCPFYMAGFCPDGKECKEGAHAKWRDDKDMKKPEVFKPKTEEELMREAEERERVLREEEEREIAREEQRERSGFGGERRGGREWRGRRRRGGHRARR